MNTDDVLTLMDNNQRLGTIVYNRNQIANPKRLNVDDLTLLTRCISEIGPLNDLGGVVQSFRNWRKGNVLIIEIKGYLPSSPKVDLVHTYRHSSGFTKITTDITIPKGFVFDTKLGIGSLVLSNLWQRYRLVYPHNEQLQMSEWKSISTIGSDSSILFSCTTPPLSIIFQYENVELEVLTGMDLWRWDRGIYGVRNQGKFELINQGGHLCLQRYVSYLDQPIEPIPRSYRFSWYLSWSLNDKENISPNLDRVKPLWNKDGELDFSGLTKLIKNLPQNTALEIDFRDILCPTSACRGYQNYQKDPLPCFVGNGAINRFKRLIRQLKAASQDTFPLMVHGLKPGICDKGRHVMRKETHRHWDLPAILDFSLWVRKILGNDFEILYDPDEICFPSMRNLFSIPSIIIDNGNQT